MLPFLYTVRANLHYLWCFHPDWTHRQFAEALQSSEGFVKKWLARIREVGDDAEAFSTLFQGHSRARLTPPQRTSQVVVERVLAIRDAPPEGLGRVPGPKAIHYYLEHDEVLRALGLPVPSLRTIARILHDHQRIAVRRPTVHEPLERPDPMTVWQLDFKDVSTVAADPEGKRQHVVETLNIIDTGTSVLLDAHVRPDFTAETAFEALAHTLATSGCPQRITIDRDPRWVGSPTGSDFPSALVRSANCLGIEVEICAPHHPQQNGFVERYNRTYQEECLNRDQPTTLEQAREVTAQFVEHYNHQRPHQGLSCGNQPPRTACPLMPSLPRMPKTVDPDGWLKFVDGLHLTRKVDAKGMVSVDLKRYYISSQMAGYRVDLRIDAESREIQVLYKERPYKTLAVKGLVGQTLTAEQFVTHMLHQARALARLSSLQQSRYRTAAKATP